MQYITLTLPCFDSGRQGPEREKHTGVATADAIRQSRSSDLTVAYKKQSGLHFICNSNCLKVMKQLETLRNPWGLLWNDHLTHNETIFYSDYYSKHVHICHRGHSSLKWVSWIHRSWIHWDLGACRIKLNTLQTRLKWSSVKSWAWSSKCSSNMMIQR